MYKYWEHGFNAGARAHGVHRLGGDMRAHEVHKGCWQVGGTTGTGVLWRHPVSSWGVQWLTLPR